MGSAKLQVERPRGPVAALYLGPGPALAPGERDNPARGPGGYGRLAGLSLVELGDDVFPHQFDGLHDLVVRDLVRV